MSDNKKNRLSCGCEQTNIEYKDISYTINLDTVYSGRFCISCIEQYKKNPDFTLLDEGDLLDAT